MRTAYHAASALDAEAQLLTLARELHKTHPGAATSLREGLAETLTVLRLGVPPTLARTLHSTNPIWVFSFPHQLALPEREVAGWWWRGPDAESDCCCSMDAFELEVSGAVTGREAGDGLA
jgi:hypothetical protein